MKSYFKPGKITAAAITACLLASTGIAQTASSPNPAGTDEGNNAAIVELSPFEVYAERDHGYQAASSVSATALATPLKESPAVVGVLTKDFLNDIGAIDINTAASWGPNVYFLDSGPEGEYWKISYYPNAVIRGSAGSSSSLARNYFVSQAPMDPATLDRVEIPRGPNASLFGSAPLGGLVNSNSKKALLGSTLKKVEMRTDSEGSLRATLDVNAGNDRLAVRVNAVAERINGWQDGDQNRSRLLLLSGTWRIAKELTFRAEALFDHREVSFVPSAFIENVSKWDQTTVYTGPRTTNLATTTGTTGISNANDYWVFDSSNYTSGPVNWKGFGRSTGYGLVTYPDAGVAASLRPGIPNTIALPSRSFSFNAPEMKLSEKDTRLFGGYLEKVFGNGLATQLAFNYTEPRLNRWQTFFNNYYVDINKVKPDGSANPHFGEWYSDAVARRFDVQNRTTDGRLLISYPLKWGFMEQNIVAMAGYRRDNYYQWYNALVRTNGTNRTTNNANNVVAVRRYQSDGSDFFGNLEGSYASGSNVELRRYQINNNWTDTKYWQVAMAGRYWNGKIATTVGLRHDYVKYDRTSQDVAGNLDATDSAQGVIYHWEPQAEFEPSSLTAGIVYFPVSWIGAFANYAEGYNVQGVRNNMFGAPWPTPDYTGVDVGLKFELMGGAISGTISHYSSKRTGVDPGAAQLSNTFYAVWTNIIDGYNNLGNTAAANTAQVNRDAIYLTSYDSRTLTANGWEADFTANLTKNWRAIFNFALPESTQEDSSPLSKAYYAMYQAEWTSHLSDTAHFDTNAITNNLKTIDTTMLAQTDGATPSGTPDYTANLYTNYRFPNGRLKGLRFGGGVQVQGPRVIGIPQVYTATSATAGAFSTPDYLATIKSPSAQVWSAMVGYEFKLWQHQCQVQLNVDNLFDNDKLIYTNVTTYTTPISPSTSSPIQGYQVPNGFRYLKPRTFALTCNVTF